MRKTSTDLTEGNIPRLIIMFALPILVGQIFQNLYNSVDAIVVGKCVGTTALAAVSSGADIAQLLVGFFYRAVHRMRCAFRQVFRSEGQCQAA